MKVGSTFIDFALTASRERKIQLNGGVTSQHLALAAAIPQRRGLGRVVLPRNAVMARRAQRPGGLFGGRDDVSKPTLIYLIFH